ncbi:hypothetical protein BJ508DRAFT_333590 [Ascobolus immersus RN42]|uniref:Uncharacterized protein n=1 Tax=Ascobolus immersus RN42 TaxID=1160509 RepID=A0A3N4HIY3_ASCIM|nr:hypothetical protein BJ508DRAFT_333590 [Ascobolus immersus RN42]
MSTFGTVQTTQNPNAHYVVTLESEALEDEVNPRVPSGEMITSPTVVGRYSRIATATACARRFVLIGKGATGLQGGFLPFSSANDVLETGIGAHTSDTHYLLASERRRAWVGRVSFTNRGELEVYEVFFTSLEAHLAKKTSLSRPRVVRARIHRQVEPAPAAMPVNHDIMLHAATLANIKRLLPQDVHLSPFQTLSALLAEEAASSAPLIAGIASPTLSSATVPVSAILQMHPDTDSPPPATSTIGADNFASQASTSTSTSNSEPIPTLLHAANTVDSSVITTPVQLPDQHQPPQTVDSSLITTPVQLPDQHQPPQKRPRGLSMDDYQKRTKSKKNERSTRDVIADLRGALAIHAPSQGKNLEILVARLKEGEQRAEMQSVEITKLRSCGQEGNPTRRLLRQRETNYYYYYYYLAEVEEKWRQAEQKAVEMERKLGEEVENGAGRAAAIVEENDKRWAILIEEARKEAVEAERKRGKEMLLQLAASWMDDDGG